MSIKELEEKKKLAAEKLEAKRLDLEKEFNTPIYAFQIHDKNLEPVDLFFKHPDRNTGSAIMAAYQVGNVVRANQLLMEICFMKEESDSRVSQEQVPVELRSEYDSLYFGAIKKAENVIKLYGDFQNISIKKK